MLEGCQIVNLNLSRNPRWVDILFYDPMFKVCSLPVFFFLCMKDEGNFDTKITSNEMVHKGRKHFLAQFYVPFHMVLLKLVFKNVNQSQGGILS